MRSVMKDCYRVMAWNAQQMMWLTTHIRDDRGDADDLAEALRHQGLRSRVIPATRRVLLITPPVNNGAKDFRLQQAGEMSDRADSQKRYKSPG
jgi:hypothetical protein